MKETETIATAGSTANNYMNISREKTKKTGESSRRLPTAAGARRRRFKTLVAPSPSSSSSSSSRAPRSRRPSTASSLFPGPGSHFEVLSSRFPAVALVKIFPNNTKGTFQFLQNFQVQFNFIFSEEFIQYSRTFAPQVQMSWNQSPCTPAPRRELSKDTKNMI